MTTSPDLISTLSGSASEVAPRLLGCLLTHGPVLLRITEVEAYEGQEDPASHAYGGRTARNQVMFGPAGHLYCYLSYGIHICVNVSVDAPDTPGAVLLRAGEVAEGRPLARERARGRPDRYLARGPGRLGQAMAIGLAHDGTDLRTGPLRLTAGSPVPEARIRRGPRVGVRLASDRAWRFWLDADPTVSTYRRHPKAAPTSS